jgi:hypothetical protein
MSGGFLPPEEIRIMFEIDVRDLTLCPLRMPA